MIALRQFLGQERVLGACPQSREIDHLPIHHWQKMTTEMKALKDELQSSRNVPAADYVIDDSAGVVIPRTAHG